VFVEECSLDCSGQLQLSSSSVVSIAHVPVWLDFKQYASSLTGIIISLSRKDDGTRFTSAPLTPDPWDE